MRGLLIRMVIVILRSSQLPWERDPGDVWPELSSVMTVGSLPIWLGDYRGRLWLCTTRERTARWSYSSGSCTPLRACRVIVLPCSASGHSPGC